MDARVCIPAFGLLGLDSCVWIPGFGFLRLDSWVWIPGLGFLALESWIWSPGLGFLDLDSWPEPIVKPVKTYDLESGIANHEVPPSRNLAAFTGEGAQKYISF